MVQEVVQEVVKLANYSLDQHCLQIRQIVKLIYDIFKIHTRHGNEYYHRQAFSATIRSLHTALHSNNRLSWHVCHMVLNDCDMTHEGDVINRQNGHIINRPSLFTLLQKLHSLAAIRQLEAFYQYWQDKHSSLASINKIAEEAREFGRAVLDLDESSEDCEPESVLVVQAYLVDASNDNDSGQEGDSQAIQEAQALQEVGKGEGGDGRKKGRGKDPHDKVISKKKAKRAGRKGVKKNADINMQPVEGMPSDVLEQLYEHYWLVLEGEMVHKCTYIYIHFCPSLSIYERDVSVPTYYVCVHVHMNVYIYVCIYIYIYVCVCV